MSSTKPLVLIIGVTGRTGGDIVNGVLATGNFVSLQFSVFLKYNPTQSESQA